MTTVAKNREDLHLDMRHDVALICSEHTSTDLLKAIEKDFRSINFTCHLVQEKGK